MVSTTSGDLTVRIAKTRTGPFFPSLLTPSRRIDVALHAVVMEAYVHDVSTSGSTTWSPRWVRSRGSSRVRSRGSARSWTPIRPRSTPDLDEQAFPYVFLDATYCKARVSADKQARAPGWSPRPWSSPLACPPTGAVRFWGARSRTPKPRTSG